MTGKKGAPRPSSLPGFIVVLIGEMVMVPAVNLFFRNSTFTSTFEHVAGPVIALAAVSLILLGGSMIARAKNRSGLWAAAGLFFFPGLAVLAVVCFLPAVPATER